MANETIPVTPATAPDDRAAEPEPRRTTSVYLPVSMLDELDEIGRDMRVSRTWLIETAVVAWLAGRRRRERD